jgi:hypothetical protein
MLRIRGSMAIPATIDPSGVAAIGGSQSMIFGC